MANNGDKPEEAQEIPIRTPEELAELRLERYKAEPQSFVEISELVFAAIKSPISALNISVMVGNVNRIQLDIAQVETNHTIDKIRMRMDIDAEMKRQEASKIVPGTMHNFARKFMKK